MKKVAIITDSNSGITQKEAKELGIFVLPMPFFINGEEYFEDISLGQDEFYQKLSEDANIGTSQPSIASLMELWEEVLKDYEEILHIPMSSGLSGSCETAMGLALDYNEKVYVVNNQRISVTQRQSVMDAIALAEREKSASQMKDLLEQEKLQSSIYITVNTLRYLKKGGRITGAAAAIGTVLNLKPVLQIQGEKLDAFSKCRGMKLARKVMIDAIKKDLETRFKEYHKAGKMCLEIAYTYDLDAAEDFKEQVMAELPEFNEIIINPLSLSVSCHIGPGALALACSKRCECE